MRLEKEIKGQIMSELVDNDEGFDFILNGMFLKDHPGCCVANKLAVRISEQRDQLGDHPGGKCWYFGLYWWQ